MFRPIPGPIKRQLCDGSFTAREADSIVSDSKDSSRKLLREKTFVNFEVLLLFMEVFSANFGGVASIGSTSKQAVKVFSAKILFFTNSQKLFHMKVSPLCFIVYTL